MAAKSASTFCFVHVADLHLDTPFSGVHDASPAVAEALREASLDAFDAIVELALDRQAAFLLVAGDVYDGPVRGLRAQLRFRDGLARLSNAGIPSFVVHGNHDPLTGGWSAIGSSWPDGVTVFGHDEVRVVAVERAGERIATVQGISFASPAVSENLALRLRRPAGEGVHLGLLHCNLDGGSTHDNYSPCSTADLQRSGLDYLALGHIHQRRVIAPQADGEPWIVYPGNSQARSPKPSEHGAKGAVVGHVENGVVTGVEFVPCDGVRFAEALIEIGALSDLAELEDRLVEAGRELLDHADGRSVLARARFVGRGPVHLELARPGILHDLLAHRREEMAPGRPFCWWDELVDDTSPHAERSDVRGRGDFSADLLELAEQIEADASQRGAVAAELLDAAPRVFASRLASLLADDGHLAELLRHATNLALDELVAER